MRAGEHEQKAGAGVSEVAAKFQRIGWGPVHHNSVHDLGTDFFVQARDDRLFERGLVVGVQVKAGPSYFEDEAKESATDFPMGWWYYEPDANHFDDWVTHGLPHLLVLHDLDADVSYWAHVTAEEVVNTGKGCKIFIPAEQTVDDEHRQDLLRVAGQQKAGPAIEGTAFGASAQTIPPGRRLRHALIAPRLVAPHRNKGFHKLIDPEEGLALIALGRLLDLRHFAERHESVPDPTVWPRDSDWKWTLVAALWTWATTDRIKPLQETFEKAPDPECQAASGVLLACALLREEEYRSALDMLECLVEDDQMSPVDHAWILVQRARIRADLGELPQARGDAATAQDCLVGDADDVTSSALASAAAWQLFVTDDFDAKHLGQVVAASDNAVSWWRSLRTLEALEEASSRMFRTWSEDRSLHWASEDREATNLFAAELNADLTGEHGTWRAVTALNARHQLATAHLSEDEEDRLSEGIAALRRSGDSRSLQLAVTRLRNKGPVTPIVSALAAVKAKRWTHTTARTNLELLAGSGDLADEDTATELVEELSGLLDGTTTTDFSKRVNPSFLVEPAAVKAVAGLLPSAGPDTHSLIAETISSIVQTTPVLRQHLAALTDRLDARLLGQEAQEHLWNRAQDDSTEFGAALLRCVARAGYRAATEELVSRAKAGDVHALQYLGPVTELEGEDIPSILDQIEPMIERTISQASKGTHTIGGYDAAEGLALFNLWHPGVARWQPLIALVTHPDVAAGHKLGACRLIAELGAQLPDEVRDELTEKLDLIGVATEHELDTDVSMDGIKTSLGIALNHTTADDAQQTVVQLASGSAKERRTVAEILGRGACKQMRPILSSLATDRHSSVRSSVANAVGRLVAASPDPLTVFLARRLVADRGVLVPRALLAGISREKAPSECAVQLAQNFISHPSATVRAMAAEVT